jgi:hypothetical protein
MNKTGLLWIVLKANIPSSESPKWYQAEGLTYYVKVLLFDQFLFPVGIILLIATLLYFKNKENYWKLFLIWIIISFVTMTYVENKNPKYTINTLPAFVLPSSFVINSILKKKMKVLVVLFSVLLISQFVFSLTKIPKGFEEVEKISKYVVKNSEGNILVDSMLGGASPFIFEIARVDNFTHQVFRPCLIEDSTESFENILKNASIEYVIQEKNLRVLTEEQRKFFEYLSDPKKFVKEKEYKSFIVFKNVNFSKRVEREIYNYVCATKEFIRSENKKPSEFLR